MVHSSLRNHLIAVALRKESVDRNRLLCVVMCIPRVALRKESVDRNVCSHSLTTLEKQSLSARRAWIEILGENQMKKTIHVALRKESVDRNSIQSILV